VAALLRVAIPTEGGILLAPVYVLPGRPPPRFLLACASGDGRV